MKRFFCLIMVLVLILSAIPALAYEELSKGSRGDAVVELQNRLNELGYSVGSADGDFGNKTHNAVCNFQRDNDLEANGIVDSGLHDLIFSATAKTKAEVEASKNTPEGFQLDIAAAKVIGDKLASGRFDGVDECSSTESSSEYKFYVQDYDTKNGELRIRCNLGKAKGVENINAYVYINYIIPLGSKLWNSEPNSVVISTKKGSHTIPKSMWSWRGGEVAIKLSNNVSLFKEIASANEFNIVLSNSNPSTLTYGTFSKKSLGFKGIKTAWEIWESAGCNKLMEIK